MSKRIIFLNAVLLLMFGTLSAASAQSARDPQPLTGSGPSAVEPVAQATDCSDRKAVAMAIYVLLRDKGFTKAQLDRINVSFNTGTKVVTLRGFVIPASLRASKTARIYQVGRLAKQATTCETSINNRLTPEKKGKCPPGKVPCGNTGQCIPDDEECNAGTMP